MFSPQGVSPRFAEQFPVALTVRPSQIRAFAEDSAHMIAAAEMLSGRYGSLFPPTAILAGDADEIVSYRQAQRLHGEVARQPPRDPAWRLAYGPPHRAGTHRARHRCRRRGELGMAAPSKLNGRSAERTLSQERHRRSLPGRMSGDLIVMAALIGISRALFGSEEAGLGSGGRSQALQEDVPGQGRGRDAETPAEIPAKGWKDIAWRVYDGIQNDRVLLVAAGVTFYALLALFPATAALVSLYGLFADPSTINEHLRLVSGFLPEGALEVDRRSGQAHRLAEGHARLYVHRHAGAGAVGRQCRHQGDLRCAQHHLQGTREAQLHRAHAAVAALHPWRHRAHAGGAGRHRRRAGRAQASRHSGAVRARRSLRLLGGRCLYLADPLRPCLSVPISGQAGREPQWRWVTWGSAIAGGIWIVGSLLLSWYVANFGTYNATYGSLGAVIGFMVWMWLSTIVVLVGAEINAEMEHQTAKDTTEGGRKPMGARGARMADEIGEARA